VSWRLWRHAREIEGASLLERFLWYDLRSHADGNGGSCFPSHRTLADHAGCNIRTVRRALSKLRELGELDWHGGRSAGKSNRYRFPTEPSGSGPHAPEVGHPDPTPIAEVGHPDPTPTTEVGHPDPTGSDTHVLGGRTPRPYYRNQDQKQVPKKKDGAPARALLDHYAAEMLRVRGLKPVIEGAKDITTFRRLLSGRELDEARWIVTEYIEHPPAWYAQRDLFEPEHILKNANAILNRKAQPKQTGWTGQLNELGGVVPVEDYDAAIRRRNEAHCRAKQDHS